MKEVPVINTIEELVAVAVKDTDTRYSLDEDVNYEYDDPVAGKAWRDGEDALTGGFVGYNDPGRDEFKRKLDEYAKLRPNMHPVKTYRLRKSYNTRYILSEELGNKVDAVWTKKKSRYSTRMNNTGLLSLPGILKRLGQTDVVDKIKDEKSKIEKIRQIQRRNNVRATLQRKLDELEKWVKDNGAEIGVTVEMFQLPVELADKLNEEKE